jgi:FkbM family methyltransferase
MKTAEWNINYDGQSYTMIGPGSQNDSIISLGWEHGEFYEEEALKWIEMYWMKKKKASDSSENGIIFDCGAHFGNHSVFFGEVLKPCRVLSFEPSLTSFKLLKQNCQAKERQFKNYDLFQAGISDKNGTFIKRIEGRHDEDANPDSHLAQAKYEESSSGILTTTIDHQKNELDIDSKNEKIWLIKADVEGFELKLLEGALDTLWVHSPLLILEAHTHSDMISYDKFFETYNLPYQKITNIKNGGVPMYVYAVEKDSCLPV